MRVDHCGAYGLMAEQLLHGTDIIACFQQTGGEAMSKSVTAARLGDTCLPYCPLDGSLQYLFINMMAAYLPAPWIR
jgi:hypothetical protein